MTENVGGRCPKDQGTLVANAGNLGEDICPQCQSRFLNADITSQLFCDMLAVREEHLHALAKEGFEKWPCPSCARKMTTTWVRGLEVELCAGCGGSFLDAGELERLGDGLFAEVKVAPTEKNDETRGFLDGIQVGVFCVQCDEEIETAKSNWLIEGRPWCAACASPYVSVVARLLAPIRFLGVHLLGFMGDLSWPGAGKRSSLDHTMPGLVDTLRVSPKNVAELYAPFFELLPRRRPSSSEMKA